MSAIVECIANFSEGRRPDLVDAIAKAASGVDGVALLDQQMDADHNRSVITIAGPPDAVAEAAFLAVRQAVQLIDMRTHRGVHPRIGAADVVPFVPIRDVTLADCAELARGVGQRIGAELGIPVFLYEAAATRPERENLAIVRRGEYEGLCQSMDSDPDRKPDFGPHAMNLKSGACAVGARGPLIAFNVYLDTDRIDVAQRIAQSIRYSDGGLRFVKALAFAVPKRGCVQISMNLTNYRKTPIHRVFTLIQSEAARWGVRLMSSEIVGLAPARAFFDCAAYHLRLEGSVAEHVLEERIRQVLGEDIPQMEPQTDIPESLS